MASGIRPTAGPESAGPESARAIGAALLVGLAAAAAALALFVWLGREVLSGGALPLHERLRALVHDQAAPGRTAFMRAVSYWAAPVRLGVVGAVLAIAFALHGWARGGILLTITLAGGGLLDVLLKAMYGRVRPSAFFDYPLPLSASFPSATPSSQVCFFGGLATLLSHRIHRRALRVVVWGAAVLAALLVGLSRVYLGVHYPGAVLAGFAVGIVWVTAVTLGDRLGARRRVPRPA